MDLFTTLRSTGAVRHFTDEPVVEFLIRDRFAGPAFGTEPTS